MPVCRNCNGEGYQEYEEDGREVRDACYHCATTGQVDEDMDFHDRLKAAAETLAYQEESDYRKAVNSDPEGDGYDMGAAENGMSSWDYFRSRVWGRTDELARKFGELPIHDQTMLVAIYEGWSDEPWAGKVSLQKRDDCDNRGGACVVCRQDDELPF